MRVLLIEDEESLGQAVQDHVRALGHAVDRFASLAEGEAALHAVAFAPAPGALELALCVAARRASSSSARVARDLARE